jgi:hypothetical protein
MSQFNRFLWTGLVLGLAACGDDVTVTNPPEPPPPPTPGVTAVSVAPDGATINVGGTLGMTAAATLEPGAAAPTWAWSSSSAAATVAGTTASATVTGVSAGSVGIRATATSGTSSASGVATVNIVAAAVCSITGVGVTPANADLVVNQTLQFAATVTGTNCVAGDLGVTWSVVGSPAGATINASGVFSATAAGNYVIRATSTKDATKTNTAAVTVIVPAPATVSIQSITQYATNVPVDLTNVGGQIEITLNVDPGAAPSITRAQALIDGVVVAEQCFSGNCNLPAASISEAPQTATQVLVLSTNTRQVRKVGNLFVPVVFNGNAQVTARIYVAGQTSPAVSNAIPVRMNNLDASIPATGYVQTSTVATEPFNDGFGNEWYTGDVQLTGINFINFSTVAPDEVVDPSCSAGTTVVANVGGSPTAGWLLTVVSDCSGDQGPITADQDLDVSYTGNGPDATIPDHDSDWSSVTSSYLVNGDPRWNLVPGSTEDFDDIYVDNVAPDVDLDNVAFNAAFDQDWVNAAYSFLTPIDSDDDIGSGVASEQGYLYNGTSCSSSSTMINTGNDLAETVVSDGTPDGYRMCGRATDNLGNVGISGVSNWFGVDKVAPVARLAGSTAATPAYVGTITVSSTANTTIYDLTPGAPSIGVALPAETWGLEGQDTRSGFNQNAVLGYPAVQSLSRLAPAAPTSCGAFTNPMNVVLSDNYVRTAVSVANNCGQGVGYYGYNGYVVDRAGNASTAIVRNFAVEDAAPLLSSIGLTSTFYTATQPANFYLFGQDDLEVLSTDLTVTYPGFPVGVTYPRTAAGTPWDATLSNLVTGAQTQIGYWMGRVDMTCTGAAAPYASCAVAGGVTVAAEYNNVGLFTNDEKNPTAVTATAYDLAQHASNTFTTGMLTAQTNDVAQKWVGAGIDLIGWRVFNLTATTVQAEHKASTSITEPYFDAVVLVKNDGVNAIVCGAFAAPVLTDNGLNRFWTYTASLPTALAAPWCAVAGTWHAVGVKAGAGLVTLPGI